MVTPLPLEGDGLVENLFHYLWTTDDLGGGPRVSVPPTVIYRGSQPVAWYFTSRRSGRIKRKHRANLTAAHIEHSFTKRRASTDIVAYYLYLPNSESTSPAIEYYDAEALREFLFKGPEIPHSSTGTFQSGGILQRFALPKGSRNSTLRAIWSPKLCLLERRVNVHAVHDARFSVYERGVTFEEGGGAEALTRPEPVRGSMLPGMVQQLCERVVDHVTRVSYHKFRIARMVLRLQVDADDRLWLLWSSSLRLQPPLAPTTMVGPDMPTGEPSIRPLDIVSDAKVPTFAFAQGSGGGPVSLSSTSSLEVGEEPRPGQTRCASCAQVVAQRALLPTTYKAVLTHFQHVLRFLREKVNEENQVAIEWPPDDRVVQQAGGVGFGILRHLKSMSSSVDDGSAPKLGSGLKTWQGRELLIPPVIRYLHPMLRTEDFARHRQDPIFLHKTVGVCERCCLVYADYATASLEANALGIRSSASAPALLRPVREKPKHAEYFDDEAPNSLLLTTTNLRSPLARGARVVSSKTKPPASAWKPVPTDDRQQSVRYKTGPRSTLHSLPMAPKLPPRIETFEPGDNDALRIPDTIIHDDGSPQHQQQQREEAFFRELYQQKDTVKRGGHALRHILDAADRLSKAKPQHRLTALGNNSQIGQSQSTGALAGAISELKLSKKPGKSPYSLVQRIRDGDGGKVSLSKAQKSGDASPAKSPLTHESKPVRKKTSKEKHGQDEAGVERTRFISSREKRAAAAHRCYLVAALSDAQVQLEHIESLATLVISAPDMEVEPIKPGLKDEQQPQMTKNSKGKRPPSPQERDSACEEQVCGPDTLKAENESQHEQQLKLEEGYQEEDLLQQEEPQIRGLEDEEEHQGEENLLQQEPQKQEPEQEEEYQDQEQEQEQHDDEFEGQGYMESHLDAQEDQGDTESMHEEEMQTQQQNKLEDKQGQTGQEKLENLDQSSLEAHNTGLDLVQESRHELTGYEQENEEGTQLKDQDLYESHSNGTANQLIDESQDQSEEVVVEHEQKGDQELDDYRVDLGSEQDLREQEDLPLADQIGQTPTCEQDAEFHQDQELGSVQQQEQVQGQEDEDQDKYDDEYEDQDVDPEQDHRHQEIQDGILQVDQVEHDDSIAAPAQNLLMQAQELLATEASSDSTDDDHRAAHGHDGSSDTGDSNDLSILTPLVPDSVAHDDDSSDDAVIAADSVVAAALPLPSSDESSTEATDE